MSKLIAPVQPLILKVADQLPTIPTPDSIMPDDSRFNIESNLMVGQLAYNIVDDKWYYRGYSSILPLNSTATITAEQVEVWSLDKAYAAGNVYVSYVNEESATPQFQTEALYRCVIATTAGQSPETHEDNWEYLGQYIDLSYLTFLALQDTPANYTDSAKKIVTVKTDESGLEFSSNVSLESIQFDLDSVEEQSEGKLIWNASDSTLNLGMPGGNSVLHVGQDIVVHASNGESVQIDKGNIVYITSSTEEVVTAMLISAENVIESSIVGVTAEDIAVEATGLVVLKGLVSGLNTASIAYATPLWLSNTEGLYTSIRPEAPVTSVFIGYVIKSHETEGAVAVNPNVVSRLTMLSDVKYETSLTTGQILSWNNVSGYFDFTKNITDYALSTDIIEDHADLAGLQGGTVGEYYHLTEAQYNALSLPNGHVIEDSSIEYTQRPNLKFLGGVSISDNSVDNTTEITISADGSSSWEADSGADEWGQTKVGDIKPKDGAKVHVENIDKLLDEELRKYGYLYKWYTITDSRGFVNGATWRVPAGTDWSTLVSYIGTDSGTKLKTVDGWATNNGTDVYGFSVKPGGIRSTTVGAEAVFGGVLERTYIWSPAEGALPYTAIMYSLWHDTTTVGYGDNNKVSGGSVRLVRNATTEEQSFTDGTELDEYVGNDGKTYRTVKIGTQVWTAENLLETKFADGTDIAIMEDAGEWNISTNSVRCSYNNDETTYAVDIVEGELHKVAKSGSYFDLDNLPVIPELVDSSKWQEAVGTDEWGQTLTNTVEPKDSKVVHVKDIDKLVNNRIPLYGYLYNNYVLDNHDLHGGLLPGFRIPLNIGNAIATSDYHYLADYLGGASVAGGKLKAVGTSYWDSPNTGATDEYNFTALPCGLRYTTNGNFYYKNTQSLIHGLYDNFPYNRLLMSYDTSALEIQASGYSTTGYGIRLVRDDYSSALDGTIIDIVYDYDGNKYEVVKIGNQAWTRQNLAATHYLDGTAIDLIEDNSAWLSTTGPAYCAYDNDYSEVFEGELGRLHVVSETGSYLDLLDRPNLNIIDYYQNRVAGTQEAIFSRNSGILIQGDLLSTDTLTVSLDTPVSGEFNQYTLKISVGTSVPTVTHPVGIVWQNGIELELAINRKYTIVYEQVEVTTGVWEIRAVVGEFYAGGVGDEIYKRETADLSVSSNNIEIDFDSANDFVASNKVAITAATTISFANTSKAQFATFKIDITNLATITFPTNSVSGDTRIVSRVFTPTENGSYSVSIYLTTEDYEVVISQNPIATGLLT